MKGYSINDNVVKELAEEYKMPLEDAQRYVNDTLKYNEISLMTCVNCNIINCEECCDRWYTNYKNLVLE